MQPYEYSSYSDKLTAEEKKEYLNLVVMHNNNMINDTLYNTAHDGFWKKVKERVDKKEEKEKKENQN